MPDICWVYWIHLPDHTDIFSEGYVGITDNLEKRFQSHKHQASSGNYTLHKALRKYGVDNIVFDIVLFSNRETCLNMERFFRPSEFIGWNICRGGGNPSTSGHCSKKQSESWSNKLNKDVPSFHSYMKSIANEIDDLKNEIDNMGSCSSSSEEHKRKFSIRKRLMFLEKGPWVNSQSNDMWLNAQEYYVAWVNEGCCGSRRLSRVLGFNERNKTISTIINYFNLGWVPENDPRWVEYEETKGN